MRGNAVGPRNESESRQTDAVCPHSPRYDISHNDIEGWVGRVLPSRQARGFAK